MRAALVILLVSWTYVGCAGTRRADAPPVADAFEQVRVLVSDVAAARTLALGAAPEGHLARGDWSMPDGSPSPRPVEVTGAGCYRYRSSSDDGTGCTPSRVVGAWQSGLREHRAGYAWLLEPVVGAREVASGAASVVAGLRDESDGLVVCFHRATPDWYQRLRHPDLAVCRRLPEPAVVRVVDASGARAALRDGAFDLALLYGRAAAAAIDVAQGATSVERAPAWDRSYALWLAPRSRWLNDPRLRRFIATVLDRQRMIDVLFDGAARPAASLLDRAAAAAPEPLATRPLAASSRPRLELSYDDADTDAARVASRVRAVLGQYEIGIELRPLRSAGRPTESAMRLIGHVPSIPDPVLTLREVLERTGAGAEDARRRLDRAARLPSPRERLDSALETERALLADARLVPLLRLEAWTVRTDGVRARVDDGGRLALHLPRRSP